MDPVCVTIYSDPGCPFGFNAQRQELALLWHYGHGLQITRRMIVLREASSSPEALGLSTEMLTATAQRLRASYGMPMVVERSDRIPATIEACRAYVGARTYEPERADLLLRALRRLAFSDGKPIDELPTIHAAGADVGITADTLDRWLADERVDRVLREDMASARAPLPEALALEHRLSKSNGGLRYSTASAVFERGDRRVVMPGFQPFAVYEVAVANVAPDLERTPPPRTSDEILRWAPYPLATAEVAEVRGINLDRAQQELESCARPVATAGGEYWSPGDPPS